MTLETNIVTMLRSILLKLLSWTEPKLKSYERYTEGMCTKCGSTKLIRNLKNNFIKCLKCDEWV